MFPILSAGLNRDTLENEPMEGKTKYYIAPAGCIL